MSVWKAQQIQKPRRKALFFKTNGSARKNCSHTFPGGKLLMSAAVVLQIDKLFSYQCLCIFLVQAFVPS